jgi:flagellar motor component MotA
MKAIQWFYLALVVLLVPATFIMGGVGILAYIDIPSIIIVFGMSYLISLSAHGLKGLGNAYRHAIKGGTKAECLSAVEVFRGLQISFILSGIFGIVVGTVAMLTALNDLESLSKGAAVCILTGLYTLIAILVLVTPFRSRVAAMAVAAE